MTLPTTIILPLRVDTKETKDVDRYLDDLVFELQNIYEDIAENVNGFIRNEADVDDTQWIPTLNGSTPGLFTYVHQYGWAIRQGIYTELFFDIEWSMTTAANNLYIELPYKVITTNGMPFVGILQTSNIAFGAGVTNLLMNAISNTYRGEIWTMGSGIASANFSVVGSGRMMGNIKYIGQEDE